MLQTKQKEFQDQASKYARELEEYENYLGMRFPKSSSKQSCYVTC